MMSGGPMIVNTRKRVVDTGPPSFATRLMDTMMGLMEFVLPKKTRSESWPM